MGRAKVRMEFIKNNKVRHVTFKKRNKSLKKKISELSILCGVEACMIVYGPNQSNDVADSWPSDPVEINGLINNYQKQSNHNRNKRSMCLSNLLEDRKKKAENTLSKLRNQNNEVEYPTWDNQLNDFSEQQLRDFDCFLESKLEIAKGRANFLKGMNEHPCYFMQTGFDLFGTNSMTMMLMDDTKYASQLGGACNNDFMHAPPLEGPLYSQFGGSCSSNFADGTPQEGPLYYDPGTGMVEGTYDGKI